MNVFASDDPERRIAIGDRRVGPAPERPVEQDDDSLDLRALVQTLFRGRWIIAVCVVTTTALAMLFVSQQEPRYTARAKMLFGADRLNVVNLEAVLVNQEFGRDGLQNQIEVLRSTGLVEQVVDRLTLYENPAFNPALRPPPTGLAAWLGSLRADFNAWLVQVGVRPPPGPPDPDEDARRMGLAIVDAVRQGLSLRPVTGSRVIDIGFTAGDPRLAAAIVNAVSRQYLENEVAEKVAAARGASEWLAGRVEELEARVQAAEEEIETTRADLASRAESGVELSRRQVEALNDALAAARARRAEMETRHDSLANAIAAGEDPATVTDFRGSAAIATLREEARALAARRTSLSDGGAAPDSAAVRLLDDGLTRIEQEIVAETKAILAALAGEIEVARAHERALAQEMRTQQISVLAQARSEIRLRQLEREAEASRALYETFLGRLQETQEQQSLQNADARVLSRAEPPTAPDAAGRARAVLLAAFGGGLLGVGLVFLLERLNNTFRSAEELELRTGLPVLAAIPMVGLKKTRSEILDFFRAKPSSGLAEAIRNLRTSILFSDVQTPPRVIMFTSSVPGEAKSTTSMLIGLTSSQMGKSAIVVDCDLRLPTLATMFRTDDSTSGLLSVLAGEVSVEAAVHRDAPSGLHVLASRAAETRGKAVAADVLASEAFRRLVEELRGKYDLVILDSPPTLAVTDARIIAALADTVVFAVRWDDTPRAAVLAGLKELLSVRAPIAGLALTLVDDVRASRYADRGYGYRAGYRRYYRD